MNKNKYDELIKKVADGRTERERGELLIKEMAQLIEGILNYNYAIEHYDGTGTVIDDRRNQVKKAIVLVKSDLDVYTKQLGLTETETKKVTDRLETISRKL